MAEVINDATLTSVAALIEKYDGIEHTLEKARARVENAKASLDLFEPNAAKAAMLAFADYVIERNH